MSFYRDAIKPRNFSPENINPHLPPKDMEACSERNKTRMNKQRCNLIFVTLMWLAQCSTQSRKDNSRKALLLFFRFAFDGFALISKWGVPQTPESNTKVLLDVARCAKLWFWIRATSLVLSVTKPGCTNSSATWFYYAVVATQRLAQGKATAEKQCYCFLRFALVAS